MASVGLHGVDWVKKCTSSGAQTLGTERKRIRIKEAEATRGGYPASGVPAG
jgi:hypothetical protein